MGAEAVVAVVGRQPGVASAADRKAPTLAMALLCVVVGSSAEPSHRACMGTTVTMPQEALGAGRPSTPTTVKWGSRAPQRYCGVAVRDGVLEGWDWVGEWVGV